MAAKLHSRHLAASFSRQRSTFTQTRRQVIYVLLFRGINVGGNKIVKMETLRRVLGEAGFGNVTTYIQSGNVVLTSEEGEDAIVATVTKVFEETFGFSSRPTIRSMSAWQRVVEGNPFADVPEAGNRLHAVFLDGAGAGGREDARSAGINGANRPQRRRDVPVHAGRIRCFAGGEGAGQGAEGAVDGAQLEHGAQVAVDDGERRGVTFLVLFYGLCVPLIFRC
jgi:hypothetical protein